MPRVANCARCANTKFRMEVQEPDGATHKVFFVQCLGCGLPVGVLPYYDVASLMAEQSAQIATLSSQVAQIATLSSRVAQMGQDLKSLTDAIQKLLKKQT